MTRWEGREASDKSGIGEDEREAAKDGATSRAVKAFQFGDICNAKERKPSG